MILLLGGTGEARKIADRLEKKHVNVIISVTTGYGADLLADLNVEVRQQKLERGALKTLIGEREIKTVIDATHPFARRITDLALAVCRELEVDYYRLERPEAERPQAGELISVSDFYEAAEKAEGYSRIFLTTGSGNLEKFVEAVGDPGALYPRLLPLRKFIGRANKAGIPPENIIAMRGPFSREFNRALIEEYDFQLLITKASGRTGGVGEKLKAAAEKNIPAIIVERPDFDYPQKADSVDELLEILEIN